VGCFPSTPHKTTYRLRNTEKDRSDGARAIEKEQDKCQTYGDVLEMTIGENMEKWHNYMGYISWKNRTGEIKFDFG